MSELKHTPGPWAFEAGDAERRSMSEVYKASDRTYRIALVNCEAKNPHVRKEDLANARLIAAAPELLEFVLAVSEFLENGTPINGSALMDDNRTFRQVAIETIAKATGDK